MIKKVIERTVAVAVMLGCSGCFSAHPREKLLVVRQPWQMIEQPKPLAPTLRPEPISEEPGPTDDAKSPKRQLPEPGLPQAEATPTEIIEDAHREATQQPSESGFVDAVQIYDYEPGAIYEIITTPGFVTVLRLRLGEHITNLAAGDTSRWLIEVIHSGVVDPQSVLDDTLLIRSEALQATRTSVLIKPRRPLIDTNLVIATNERTYLMDLKSVESSAYHSVVEWTYPKASTSKLQLVPTNASAPSDNGTRNYSYLIKVPPGRVPPWSPVSVFDDGHRVHVQFSKKIDSFHRPPLFIVGDDGSVRLVNYHVDERSYVVHELFDRAELRMGRERVVIDRIKPKPNHPIAHLFRALGLTE